VRQALPARIARYEIEAELGRGMMGVVYQARDPELGRTVALKTISLAFAVSEADAEAFKTRFLEEARIAARLSHPGIVVVHEVGRDVPSDTLYIALEHLRGQTLADRVGGGRTLPWREAVHLVAQVARALQHAHAHGVVHRDIKPANIMVLESGEAKVLDFGVAKAPASQLTATGQFFGTPAYMSPEQASGEPLDGRSDLFSLGCVLYVALTGRRPFDGENVPLILSRVRSAVPEPPSRMCADIPPGVDVVVARAMAKDPAARYPGGGAMADDLEALLAGRAPRAAPVPEGLRTVATRPKAEAELEPLELVPDDQPPAAAPPRATPPATSLPSRRALMALGAAVLAAGAWLARPRSTPPVDPAQASADAPVASPRGGVLWRGLSDPAYLAVDFDHHLRSGTLEVWVDDEPVLEEPIEGRVKHKVLSFRLRKGSLQQTLEVAPGVHEVRVQVSWEGRRRSARISGPFHAGATRRLEVSVSRLTRDLTLEWR
jgi:tRNA A-37 threonylcarbamoyl transferase component Bud32